MRDGSRATSRGGCHMSNLSHTAPLPEAALPRPCHTAAPPPPISSKHAGDKSPPLNPNSTGAAATNGANPPRSRRTRRQSPSHSRTTPSHHLTGDGPGRGGRRSRAHGSGRVSVYKLLHTSRSNKLNKSKMLAH
jgi:hypothetical protein